MMRRKSNKMESKAEKGEKTGTCLDGRKKKEKKERNDIITQLKI